ncbi:MAG: hypothetical protein PVG64_03880, partial [Syntrophobacterales bacterium]
PHASFATDNGLPTTHTQLDRLRVSASPSLRVTLSLPAELSPRLRLPASPRLPAVAWAKAGSFLWCLVLSP